MKIRLFLTCILIVHSFNVSFSKPKKKNKIINDYKFEYRFNLRADKEIPSKYNILKSVNDSDLNKKDCRFIAHIKDSSGENLLGVNIAFYNDKNVETGTISDVDGKVDLIMPKSNYKVNITYVGYTTLIIDSLQLKDKNSIELEIILGDSPIDDFGGFRCRKPLTKQELDEMKEQMRKNIVPSKVKCKDCMQYIEI